MKTIIAEKPSVAREIARIVGASKREEGYFSGNGYAVTWAYGHLVQLTMPEGYGIHGFAREHLPILPDTFTLQPRHTKTEKGYKPEPSVVTQIRIVGRLFSESEQIVVATDAGREGELIFRYLYSYLNCRTPFVRLWISSLTDKAIREGLRHLEEGNRYDRLYHAAKARSEADWLVGINATQAMTIAAGRGTYSLGRVQTPTLAMVCARYWEHKRFTPEAFWQVHLSTDGTGEQTVKFSSVEKWKEKSPAEHIYNKVKAQSSLLVTKVECKEKVEDTPLLYDLTTLQKEANAKHGLTAEKTLEIAQKLYEKKLITYPRTGSRYIPEDVFAEIPKLLAFLGGYPEWIGKVPHRDRLTRRSVDGSKVTDHHALLVTGEKPLFLSKEDNTVYQMIAGRMVEAFSCKCVKELTTVTALSGEAEFAAHMERSLYNALPGAVNSECVTVNGGLPFDSYSPLLPGTRGRGIGGFQVMPDKHHYGCCACIGAAGAGLISKVAGMISEKGVAVNLYMDAVLALRTPENQPLTLSVSGNYPAEGNVSIAVALDNPERFTVSLRIPEWSKAAAVRVNGEEVQVTEGYTNIERVWEKGDRIELVLDMRTRVIHAPRCEHDILMTARSWELDISYPTVFTESPDAKFHIALRRGPVILARDARLGENVDAPVNIKYDLDGVVAAEPSDSARFEKIVEFKIPQVDGSFITVVDYGSAGKTWDENSRVACWMPTR